MDAYYGEIRAFPYSYIPQGWLACNGQTLQVIQYQVLYSLIGNVYGGTAGQTFKLPNLQAMAPIGLGSGPGLTPRAMGQTYGAATVTLSSISQLPPHDHGVNIQIPVQANLTTNTLGTPVAGSSWLARPIQVTSNTTSNAVVAYTKNTGQTPNVTLHANTIGVTGGIAGGGTVAPHENRQPALALVFCICNDGIYPDFN